MNAVHILLFVVVEVYFFGFYLMFPFV